MVFQRARSDGESEPVALRDKVSAPRNRLRRIGRARRQTAPTQSATDTGAQPEDDIIQWSELETSSEGQQLKDNDETETLEEDSSSQQNGSREDSEDEKKLGERVRGPKREVEETFPRPNEPHFYVDTEAPPDDQLLAAGHFFRQNKPKFAFSCSRFLEFPDSSVPEFCFVGRSNVGKSSLLNALFYANFFKTQVKQDLAKTGRRAGKTKTLNVFLAGNIDGGTKNVLRQRKMKPERWISTGRGIAIVDMPGYGFGSSSEQGEEIMKYLSNRKQLRRTFVLLNSDHEPTNDDREICQILEQAGISYQIVLTKVDKHLNAKPNVAPSKHALKRWSELLHQTKQKLLQCAKPPIRDILCVSAVQSLHAGGKQRVELIGMNGLRLAILQAAGMDQTEIPALSIDRTDPHESGMRRRRQKEVVQERRQARLLAREMHEENMERGKGRERRENAAAKGKRSGRK